MAPETPMAPQVVASPGERHQHWPENPLPKGLDPDPSREFVKQLEEGKEPGEVMAGYQKSIGFGPLLPGCASPSERWSCRKKPRLVIEKVESGLRPLIKTPHREDDGPGKVEQLQEAWRLHLAGDPSAPRSTLVVHDDQKGLLSAAKDAICTTEWFLNPAYAVVICADNREADEVLAQLHQPGAHQGNNDDPFDSARWIAEEIEAPYPGWKFDGASPVRLASEVGPDDLWAHVYLSPGCRSLSRLELLPAVHKYPVSLHFVRQPQH